MFELLRELLRELKSLLKGKIILGPVVVGIHQQNVLFGQIYSLRFIGLVRFSCFMFHFSFRLMSHENVIFFCMDGTPF